MYVQNIPKFDKILLQDFFFKISHSWTQNLCSFTFAIRKDFLKKLLEKKIYAFNQADEMSCTKNRPSLNLVKFSKNTEMIQLHWNVKRLVKNYLIWVDNCVETDVLSVFAHFFSWS